MDIKLVMRSSTVYLLSFATITVPAVATAFIIINRFPGSTIWTFSVVLIIALAIFSRIKNFYYRLANKYFFASLYDPGSVIASLSDKLRRTLDASEIIDAIAGTLANSLHPGKLAFLLYGGKDKDWLIAKNAGFADDLSREIQNLSGLISAGSFKNNIVAEEIGVAAKNLGEGAAKRLSDLGIEIITPLVVKRKLIGAIILGAKESKDMYNDDDLKVLETVGAQAAIAIENALLYGDVVRQKEELKHFNEKLEEKVDEQTEEIKRKNKFLEGLLEMKTEFLHVVHHQLNTPISIMNSALSMIEDKSMPLKKGLMIAKSGLGRISETMNDFWQALELEGEEMEMNIKKTDLMPIVSRLVEEKKNLKQAKERRLKIAVKAPKSVLPPVFCDIQKITHVLSNLLDNAVYYSPKGSICVSFEKTGEVGGDFLTVRVADTGAGIDPEDLEKIFARFHRGKQGRLLRPDGSGLGLYISRKMVEENGGELVIEKTELGKGTTFCFTLPLNETGAVRRTAPSGKPTAFSKAAASAEKIKGGKRVTASKPAPGGPPKILLVEDEPDLITIYKLYFDKAGCDFYCTDKADEAQVIARTVPINVILLDIVMPRRTASGSWDTSAEAGFDCLKQFKANPITRDIPVIMFTNLNSDEIKEKSFALGASGYIFKAETEPKQVLATIKNVLGIPE